MVELIIRRAIFADIPAITAIYAEAVSRGTASFELDPPDVEEMSRRMAALAAGGFPYLVAETGRRVMGYAYAGPYRTRPAYRNTVENSVYVDLREHGRGVGGALLRALIAEAEGANFRQMVAVIGGSDHVASRRLHEREGFVLAGLLRNVGWKHNRWLDSVLMQRALGRAAAQPPDRAQRLAETDGPPLYHLVYLRKALLLMKLPPGAESTLPDRFADFKAALGPWPLDEVLAFLKEDRGGDRERDAAIWAFAAAGGSILSL